MMIYSLLEQSTVVLVVLDRHHRNTRKLIQDYERGELDLLLQTLASCKRFILLSVLLPTS